VVRTCSGRFRKAATEPSGGVPAEADRQHQQLRGVLLGLGATPARRPPS
jgi:hypothetical protein